MNSPDLDPKVEFNEGGCEVSGILGIWKLSPEVAHRMQTKVTTAGTRNVQDSTVAPCHIINNSRARGLNARLPFLDSDLARKSPQATGLEREQSTPRKRQTSGG